MDEDAFLHLLYAAAAEPERWEFVLERFADLIGGSSVWLSRLSVVDGLGTGILARIDPGMPDLYNAHFAACNPLNNVKDPDSYWRGWTPRIITDEDWMPKEALVRSEYYNDFLRPQDIHTTMMIRLAPHPPEVSVINVNRPIKPGRFDRQAIACAERLHPHLIRAYALSQRLVGLRGLTEDLDAALDTTDQAIFLLEDGGRLRHANRAAEAILAEGGALCLNEGRLSSRNAQSARGLDRLIAAASQKGSACQGGRFTLPSPRGPHPLEVTIAPQRLGPLAAFGARPCLVVCVTDPTSAVAARQETLRGQFGFTPAETRVALAIGEGASPRQAAERLGVSFHTVRNQLRSVYEKAGVNRQTELVLMLTRSLGVHSA